MTASKGRIVGARWDRIWALFGSLNDRMQVQRCAVMRGLRLLEDWQAVGRLGAFNPKEGAMKRGMMNLVFIVGAAMLLAACSSGGGDGGSSGAPPAAVPLAGVFVDSPVHGLGYTTSTGLSGTTDAAGSFGYNSGDTMTFTLYGRTICSGIPAAPVITALSCSGATSLTDAPVVNLSQLLLTLGGIPTGQNPIQLPITAPPGLTLPDPLNFSSATFDADIQTALTPAGFTLVSEPAATTHLGTSFKTLAVTIVNSGTITSNPAGINCTTGTCSAVFQTGTVVTLTATGTGFTGWSSGTGSAACTGAGTCVVTVNADSTITATFPVAPPPATLNILSNGGTGTGIVECNANNGAFGPCATSYPNPTSLVIRATATGNSTFTGWSNGTGNALPCDLTTVDCSITLTANSEVRANFTLPVMNSVTSSTATANGGGGTVLCSANGGAAAACGSYTVGTAIVMTATPNAASNFTGWSNGSGNANVVACNGTTGTCNFTLTANTTITANFSRPILSVTVMGTGSVNSNPAGINICTSNCTAPFNRGTAVTLTASGANFTGWSGGCSGIGVCIVTLNANTSVTATFGPVAVSAIVGGWQIGSGAANDLSVVTFMADGTFVAAEDSDTLDGIERGTYTWDPTTGALTASLIVDTNGPTNGLSGLSALTLTVTGDTFTVISGGSLIATASRITDAANPLVGSWRFNDVGGAGTVLVLTLFSDGKFVVASQETPFFPDGMERGTYVRAANGDSTFTVTLDTSGIGGITDSLTLPAVEAFNTQVSGNTMTVNDPSEPVVIMGTRVGM
jgi:hypothetical protein